MTKVVLFWSGGKDSALALYKAICIKDLDVIALVCTISEESARIAMHGTSEIVLARQCQSLQIPLIKMYVPDLPANEKYEEIFCEVCSKIKQLGADTVIFGDIFLEDLRKYRENIVLKQGLKVVFPLWKIPSSQLMKEFISLGFKAITCCINHQLLDKKYLGRVLDEQFVEELPSHVDPCGEYGEYHTLCFDGPVFKYPIDYKVLSMDEKVLSFRSNSSAIESRFLYIDII